MTITLKGVHRDMYGFYSQASVDNGLGFSVWKNSEGENVRVTLINSTDDSSGYDWPDVVRVGLLESRVSCNEVSDMEIRDLNDCGVELDERLIASMDC